MNLAPIFSDLSLDVGDIAKTLGGVFAFAVVLYIGVLFYKKESSFSDEYVTLLKQYKDRNAALQAELETQRREHEHQILENKKEVNAVNAEVAKLREEVAYLRNLLATGVRPV